MVNRREIESHPTPCTVVDLDGTYVDGNTLKIYLSCGMRYLIAHKKFRKVARLMAAVAKRKARLSTHAEMKAVILATLYPYPDILSTFREEALKKVNPVVEAVISQNSRNGQRILLATAAPDFYVRSIWSGDFVATVFDPEKALVECMGDEKLRRVRQWAEANNCRVETVITDHKDDAPLFAFNQRGTNILVNPSRSTLGFFREFEPAHFLLIEEIGNLGVTE